MAKIDKCPYCDKPRLRGQCDRCYIRPLCLVAYTTSVVLGMLSINKQEPDYIDSFVNQNPHLIISCYDKKMTVAEAIEAMNYREVPWTESTNNSNRTYDIRDLFQRGDEDYIPENIMQRINDHFKKKD